MLPLPRADEAPVTDEGAASASIHPDDLHRLVLLYLALAYGTDHDLHPAEHDAMVRLLCRWSPETDVERIRAIVEAAFAAVRSGSYESAEALAMALRPSLVPDLRRQVLTDLGVLAKADGWLSIREAALIGQVRALWHETA